MPRATSRLTDKQWAEAFAASVANREKRPVGEGWRTFGEIHALLKCGNCSARNFISDNLKAGKLEREIGYVESKRKPGKLGREIWYRWKK
jgi:hypothetical protein